jgi:transcription-repair coupling factor (superfamily II helicase)
MAIENLENIVNLYTQSKLVKDLEAHLTGNAVRAQLQGLVGSSQAFVLAACFVRRPRPVLFIADDKEQAAYFSNDLENILPNKPIHYFPDSFKRPAVFDEIYNAHILQRTEAIQQLTAESHGGGILVTYPEALFETVVAPSAMDNTRLSMGIGEKLDADFVLEVLVEYGFERVDFVYEPGQFSVRGGIIDIFSFGNEWPYRVELWDDVVESLRTFDPSDQLSLRKISKLSILPNVNTRFSKEEKVPLWEVLPKDTLVWIQDVDNLVDRLRLCEEKSQQYAKKWAGISEQEELAEILKEFAFVRSADTLEKMTHFDMVVNGRLPSTMEVCKTFHFETIPQPSFNKNFKLLIQNLQENETLGISNYIFTENAKQIERFYSIFEDLGVKIQFHPVMKSIGAGFVDKTLALACYTDHQIFSRFHRYKTRKSYSRDLAMNLRLIRDLQPGDFVTHIDHGVGKYSGLEKIEINGRVQESVRLLYRNNDILYVSINALHKISKYTGKDGSEPGLSKLGSDAWKTLKSKAKKKIKDIAQELIKLYALRKASQGHAFPPDGFLQNELEASFLYEDTPDQFRSTQDVKMDMQKSYPMDRLVCGDVGFGKTEVAIRAAFKAVTDGKQVAVLVPTTILALQHAKTFRERLGEFAVKVDYVNRFRSTKEKNEIYKKLENGEIEIIIGTHALLNQKVTFKDLGLLIIDEEQKFGVSAKEKLRGLKVNVDTLTLTATPIPRTLQFSLMAARDLSVIRTPPPNRYPIHTEVRTFNEQVVQEAIQYEMDRGGQVFFVHNRVKSLHEMGAMVKHLCPEARVAVAHGQMDSNQLEETLLQFIDGQFDVLVSTNIIETGLDIPNANTIIIHNAHHYGLSDLHQLRGRVGRSNRKAFCYLFSPPFSTLTEEARKRLKTLEEFSELGSGFEIAMKDLDIRGAGNLLGAEQSGFIFDIGYETYQKVLEEAIAELKQNEFKDLFAEENTGHHEFVREVQIDTDTEMHIPDYYVASIQERLHLYTRLDNTTNSDDLDQFERELTDRFGKIPGQVKELFHGLKLRWTAKAMGIERLILKQGVLKCFFISQPQSGFYETDYFQKLLKWIAKEGAKEHMEIKNKGNLLILTLRKISNLDAAFQGLEKLNTTVLNELSNHG